MGLLIPDALRSIGTESHDMKSARSIDVTPCQRNLATRR